MTIRPATPFDMAAVNDLRNSYVRSSTAIYTEEETSLEDRQAWLHGRDLKLHPVIVATEGDEVVGWASLSAYNEKCGYRATVEDSVYVRADHHGRGVGRALLSDVLERGKAGGAHLVLARIDSEQLPSIRLHEKLGFSHIGVLREAGWKFGRWLSVVYMQKLL